MPWRYQICIAKCIYSYRESLPENLGKYIASELRVVKSSWLSAKMAAYLVSIGRLLCLAFLYRWHFLNKISLDWQLSCLLHNFLTTLCQNARSPLLVDVRRSKTSLLTSNWTVGEDRGIRDGDKRGQVGWERKEWEVGIIRGRETNKGNYTTMLNILQSKDSLREESNRTDGSRECKVQEAGGLNPLSTDRLWHLMTLLLQGDNLCTLLNIKQIFKHYIVMYFFYTDPCFHDKHSKKI